MAKKLNQLTAQPSTPADSDVIAWGQAGGSGLAYKMTFTQLKAKLDAMAGGGDTTAPAISSRTVENATPNRIDLTYNEALDTGSVPANGDFTVSGGRTVTGVAVVGSQVRITVNTAYANGDTITVGYTPGTNKIQDVAGNDAPAITAGTSVTNNISGGAVLEDVIFDVVLNLTAAGTVWTGSAAGYNSSKGVMTTKKLASGQDGYVQVECDTTNGNDFLLGFSNSSANHDYDAAQAGGFAYCFTGGQIYRIEGGTPNFTSPGSYADGDLVRIKRTGSVWTLEKSTDAGSSWSTVNTLSTTTTADVWIHGYVENGKKLYNPKGYNLS